jgi:hypothetical protein
VFLVRYEHHLHIRNSSDPCSGPRMLTGVSCEIRTSTIESKAISIPGRGGPYSCVMLRIPHCLDSRLSEGGKVVSLTR